MNRKNQSLEDIYLENVKEIQFEKDLLNCQQIEKYTKNVIAEQKSSIDHEYEQKLRKLQAERKIKKSALINQLRIKVAHVKYELCEKIFYEVLNSLSRLSESGNQQYQLILLNFIVDGCIRMFESEIKIHVLEKDIPTVKILIPQIKKSFDYFMQEEMGRSFQIDLQVMENDCLKQRDLLKREMDKNEEDRKAVGGVVLGDSTGNIVYKNTFDTRLNIIKQAAYPLMREILWDNRAKE